MQFLEELWSDHDMEGLPFSTRVNPADVLTTLTNIQDQLSTKIHVKVKQWIRFHYFMNEILFEQMPEKKKIDHDYYMKIDDLFKSKEFGTVL